MNVLTMPIKGGVPSVKRKAIIIIIPCLDKPNILFCHSLANMAFFCGQLQLPIYMVHQSGSAIQKVRNLAMKYVEEEVEKKQGLDVEWIMWLDSDMTFPQYLVPALMRHDKDIIGCAYVRRTKPFDIMCQTLSADPIDADKVEGGLLEVASLPTGVLLVRRDVFRKMKKPYFRMPFREESEIGANDQMEYGEDYTLCATARVLGYKIWLDVQLTKLVGHVSERPLFPEEDGRPIQEAVNG